MKRSLLLVFAVSGLALLGCQRQEPAVEELPPVEEEPATTPAPMPAAPVDTMPTMQMDTMADTTAADTMM